MLRRFNIWINIWINIWVALSVLGSVLLAVWPDQSYAEKAPASAQTLTQSLTLEDALQQVLRGSPRLQRAQAAANEADWKQVEARSYFMPTLALSANHYFDQKYQLTDVQLGPTVASIPLIIPESQATLSAAWTIFDGLQSFDRYAAVNSLRDAAHHDADWIEFQLAQEIRLKFYQVIGAEQLALVANQNVKTLQDHLAQTRVLRKAGASTQFDVLRTEVQVTEAQSEQLQAQDNVILARRALLEAMNSDSLGEEAGETLNVRGELPVPKADLIERLKFSAQNTDGSKEGRRDLLAMQERLQASSKNSSAAATWWTPRISLVGNYFYYNNRDNSISNTDQYRNAWQVGVLLNWTLFDGLNGYAKSQQAAAQELQAQKSLMLAQRHQPEDFNLWKRRYVYSTALYQAKVSAVQKAQESVRLATEGYRAGARTNSDVLDAELELFRARAGVVGSQLSSVEALMNLETAIGRRISDVR